MKLTEEQEAIGAAAAERRESLMVKAYAGCAKTTTLELVAQRAPQQPAMALAFNVKIKQELERRFPSHFAVRTLNGLGHMAFGKTVGKRLEVDERKLGKLVTEGLRDSGATPEQWDDLRRLVTAAQNAGLVPSSFPHIKGLTTDTPDNWQRLIHENFLDLKEEHAEIAREVLDKSVRLAYQGVISYDDQIYMSALFGGVFPKVPLLLVDEAQDLSPLNHIQIAKSATDRLIVVGDDKQAIYAFRGADSESMAKLRALRADWIDLPLTMTFRCPKAIVARHQAHAPGFRAFVANAAGKVLGFGTPEKAWHWEDVERHRPPSGTVAVLCRNNAPLLKLAFKLLRQRIPVVMLGRDIGKGLIALSRKIMPDDSTPIKDAAALIEDWLERESALARANGKEEKVAGLTDRAESLLAVVEVAGAKDAGDLRAKLKDLFERAVGKVTLSTIHRAKGLEWDVVVHLDPWRIPSKYALKSGDQRALQQEYNLLYVCETRAKQTLVNVNLEHFE